MRTAIQQAKKLSPVLNSLLRQVGPGFGAIYTKHFSSSVQKLSEITFTSLKAIDPDDTQSFIENLSNKVNSKQRIDIGSSVYTTSSDDIELSSEDKVGQIILVAKDDISVHYGEQGIAPSKDIRPDQLLKKSIEIPRDHFGVLDIPHHTPFRIMAKPRQVFALKACELKEVLDHEDSIQRYSLTKVVDLPSETAKIISLRLQQSILENKKNEYFYEEITSRLYAPSKYNRSSGTLMSFDSDGLGKNGEDKTTSSHYHPGERSLYIVTTHKAAGVTLNFCGINEIPEERKDCEVSLKFSKNSLIVLNFPPHTHHKFDGEFVCVSVHPREGGNLIEALQSGLLPRGFLESATVFSKTLDDEKEQWNSFKPTPRQSTESQEKSK
jgi:hypothetical protein